MKDKSTRFKKQGTRIQGVRIHRGKKQGSGIQKPKRQEITNQNTAIKKMDRGILF